MVGEFEFIDRYSYHPKFVPVLDRNPRDEPFIKILRDALERFCDEKDEIERKVRASGFFEDPAALRTGVDRDLADYLGA